MAVSDYVPDERKPDKISSGKEELIIRLVKTQKAINIIRNMWPESYLVGFKLVVQKRKDELLQIAQDLLTKSAADLIIANDSQDMSNKDHIAYFVCNNLKMTKRFCNKKEIAKALIHHLEQQFT
jgi:phosphopantothenate-cysteine ligase